ncbi:MAG TPA: creatininase family protein [Pyrinomonadaceae bacterium]|nr:creatininase family protein [Pyrinomonadaceae bacterium]
MKKLLSATILIFVSFLVANGQVYRVAEMNATQIRALDKQKTVVILPGGVLEQHGPHLPSFTDGYSNEWITQKVAASIAARPGWSVLIFPTIPLGHGGANEIGGKYSFPGTYSVRRTTLRALFMDLAGELGEQGFRWVFIMHGHGAPHHNLILDQAGDFFRDTYGGRMVHLRGLQPTKEQLAALKVTPPDITMSDADKNESGLLDLHAGFDETSRLMFVRPDLVDAGYKNLSPLTVNQPADLFQFSKPNWLGYIGSPRLANAKAGQLLQEYRATRDAALVLAIVDGKLDERDVPHYATETLKRAAEAKIPDLSAKNEQAVAQKQLDWMKTKGIE